MLLLDADRQKVSSYSCQKVYTYDFSTLYTTLPHDWIKDKLSKLIEKTFAMENRPFLARNASHAFDQR